MTLEEFKTKSGFTTNQQVASALGLSVHTVNSWSSERKSPSPWSKLQMQQFLENQNAQRNAQRERFAQFRKARGLSDEDFCAIIEANGY